MCFVDNVLIFVSTGFDIHLPKISMPSFHLKRSKSGEDKEDDKEEKEKEPKEEEEKEKEPKEGEVYEVKVGEGVFVEEQDSDKKKKKLKSKGLDFHVNLPKFPSFSRKKKGEKTEMFLVRLLLTQKVLLRGCSANLSSLAHFESKRSTSHFVLSFFTDKKPSEDEEEEKEKEKPEEELDEEERKRRGEETNKLEA